MGKRLHSVSVTENGWLFKGWRVTSANVSHTSEVRQKIENANLSLHFAMCCCDCSLVGIGAASAKVVIPEVLIGEINFGLIT
ncbi:hypothetical protein ACNKHK_18210 [Shigella flexneri]